MSERLKRFNFLHLLYLRALVEERNVTRAAERMGVGQPAMSSALAKMRLLFKDSLLVSTRNGMEPTPRALELVTLCQKIAALSEGRGVSAQAFIPAESMIHWKIMASDALARALLPSFMATISEQAPRMRLTIQPGDPRQLLDYLGDGEFDLAVTFVRNPANELRQVSLAPQKLVGIARTGHAYLQCDPTVKQFCNEAHARWGASPISYITLEAMVDEKLARLGYYRDVRLVVSSMSLLPEVVSKTNLLAIVPERIATQARNEFSLEIFRLPFKLPQVEVSLVWHERMHNDPAHKWLRRLLADITNKSIT